MTEQPRDFAIRETAQPTRESPSMEVIALCLLVALLAMLGAGVVLQVVWQWVGI